MGGGEWSNWLQRCRQSRKLVLVIVAIALLLDNMLLTTVGKWLYLLYRITLINHVICHIFDTFLMYKDRWVQTFRSDFEIL